VGQNNVNEGDSNKSIFDSVAEILQMDRESSRKTYAEKVTEFLEYLEGSPLAGPEWLHEALDRFYDRERARSRSRSRQKARRRKKSKKPQSQSTQVV
jgi:hypothetical protein